MHSDAVVSDCGKYRYRLKRRWGEGEALVFVMLNPSTADASQDDATIRKCIGFAKINGFNAIDVVNLYAYRATKPSSLKIAGYPVGEDNDYHISMAIRDAGKVVLAWGDNAREQVLRVNFVLGLIKSSGIRPVVLKFTTKMIPSHPLMLPYSCDFIDYYSTIKN